MRLPDYDTNRPRECHWCFAEIIQHRQLPRLWIHTGTHLHRCRDGSQFYAQPKGDPR